MAGVRSTGLAAVALLALLATPAAATTIIGSGAYGLNVNLSVLNVVKAQLGPVSSVGGIAGSPYNLTSAPLSVAATTFALSPLLSAKLNVSTGVLTSTAYSPFPVTPTGDGNALVNNLALSLTTKALPILPTINVLTLGARTVNSHSSAEGVGNPSATGSSTIEGLGINILGLGLLDLSGSLFVNAAPNTDVLNLLGLDLLPAVTGLKIILNEQIKSGDNINDAAITTNAIHLIFNNFLVGSSLIKGDILVAESRAYIRDSTSPTPEPAVWLQMIAGFGAVGLLARRRRTVVA